MPLQRDRIERIFEHLEQGRLEAFFEHVAENVRWTVMGGHIFAGTYYGRHGLRESRFLPILVDLANGTTARILAVHLCEDVAVVEFRTCPHVCSRVPGDMSYCWIARFSGDQIVEVRAYPDPAIVNFLMQTR